MKNYSLVFLFFFLFGVSYAQLPSKNAMVLHLRADTLLSKSKNTINYWASVDGKGKEILFYPNNLNSTSDTIRDYPTVLFNGNYYLYSDSIFNISNCFVLLNSTLPLLFTSNAGIMSTLSYLGDRNDRLFDVASGTTNITEGVYAENGTVYVDKIQTKNLAPITRFSFVEGQYPPGHTYNSLEIGDDFSDGGRYWNGNFVEIIAYSSQLSAAQRDSVYQYINNKYFSRRLKNRNVNCWKSGAVYSTGLSFTLWPDGDTSGSKRIYQKGEYAVYTNDLRDSLHLDTITFNQVINTQKPIVDKVCQNGSVTWNTGLSKTQYTFLWNGSSTDSFQVIQSPGTYYVKIQDKFSGCEVYDTLQIISDTVNTLKSYISLGNDTTLCSNNYISLTKGFDSSFTFRWSTGSTGYVTQVTNTGNYSVNVTNLYGCTASDTVMVTIKGQAPLINFTYDTACIFDSVGFYDRSIYLGSAKSGWLWNANGQTSTRENPRFLFNATGPVTVQFTANNVSGCSNRISQVVKINPKPQVAFKNSLACSGSTILLTNQTTITGGQLKNYCWVLNAGSARYFTIKPDTLCLFTQSGNQTVKLFAHSDKSCLDSVSQSFNVLTSPSARFTLSNATPCVNNTITLQDQSVPVDNTQSVATLYWNLGDSTTYNTSIIPPHAYNNPGNYTIKLLATSSNGCTNTASKTIQVKARPVASISVKGPFCNNSTIVLKDSATGNFSQPDTWLWNIGSVGNFTDSIVYLKKPSPGNYLCSLVVAKGGCFSSQVYKNFTINASPGSSFSVSPGFGLPPLTVNTTNNTPNVFSNQYLWLFDTLSRSTAFQPSYTFTGSGVYTVRLIGTDSSGCSDTASSQVFTSLPSLYVSIVAIAATTDSLGNIQLTITLCNKSNRVVTSGRIYLNADNSTQLWTNFLDNIPVNGCIAYALPFQLSSKNLQSGTCVEFDLPNGLPNLETVKNKSCYIDGTRLTVEGLYPNPAQDVLYISYAVPQTDYLYVNIYDYTGVLIYQSGPVSTKAGLYTYSINTGGLALGIYLVSIRYQSQTWTGKFVKD